jgi:hypothetical protein
MSSTDSASATALPVADLYLTLGAYIEAAINLQDALQLLIEGNPDAEDGGDLEPSLGAVAPIFGGVPVLIDQRHWGAGVDDDREMDVAEMGIADNDAVAAEDAGYGPTRFTAADAAANYVARREARKLLRQLAKRRRAK